MDSKTKGKGANVKKVPSELKCPTCSNLLTDAVLIPCCGTSYCDECKHCSSQCKDCKLNFNPFDETMLVTTHQNPGILLKFLNVWCYLGENDLYIVFSLLDACEWVPNQNCKRDV